MATMDLLVWAEKADGTRELATSLTLKDTAFGFSAIVTDMLLGV